MNHCVHIRNMQTAIDELILCESEDSAKAVRYAVNVLVMEPDHAVKYEATAGFDMNNDIDRQIFWNDATNGHILEVVEINYRPKDVKNNLFTVDNSDYHPINNITSIDFYWC